MTTIQLQLTDQLLANAQAIANARQCSIQDLLIEYLRNLSIPEISSLDNDPLFQLAGCITTDLTDVADNHDYYIGQALYEEMYRDVE
jgi:hypothetical protein